VVQQIKCNLPSQICAGAGYLITLSYLRFSKRQLAKTQHTTIV